MRGSRDTGGYKRGKVYRSMYGFQEEKAAHLGDDWKSVPLLFYHPYMKDVSYAYYPDTLRILTGIPDGEVCYLATFHGSAFGGSCACARSASGKMEIPNTRIGTGISSHEIYQRQLLSFRLPLLVCRWRNKYVSSGLGENSKGSFV